jgi:antitoxin (DNA-binding transcriptional repressor) of toxin-antitoxin stability system
LHITNLSGLLYKVQEGEEIIIARGNKPMAWLVPYKPKRPVRSPGYLKGKIKVADDFNAQLPDEVLDAF